MFKSAFCEDKCREQNFRKMVLCCCVLLCIAVYLCLLGVLRAGTDTHDVLCCCVRCLCLFVSWYRDIKSFAAVCCVCVYELVL